MLHKQQKRNKNKTQQYVNSNSSTKRSQRSSRFYAY